MYDVYVLSMCVYAVRVKQDWADVTAIARARLDKEPAVASALPADHQFVQAGLAYMTADANK
jgi:hypothetical protein